MAPLQVDRVQAPCFRLVLLSVHVELDPPGVSESNPMERNFTNKYVSGRLSWTPLDHMAALCACRRRFDCSAESAGLLMPAAHTQEVESSMYSGTCSSPLRHSDAPNLEPAGASASYQRRALGLLTRTAAAAMPKGRMGTTSAL